MKTININLIGQFAKAIKSGKLEFQKDGLDAQTRIFVIVFILGTLFILLTSFTVWLTAKGLSIKADKNLLKLKTEIAELQNEEAKLTAYAKDLKTKKELAILKLRAKKQIDGLFMPWSMILKDLAAKVPKNIIINDIKKSQQGKDVNGLTISGIISSKVKPLTEVSFLIFNINEDKESLLTNASIKTVEYDKESGMYKFEIETTLKKMETKSVANKEPQILQTPETTKKESPKPPTPQPATTKNESVI